MTREYKFYWFIGGLFSLLIVASIIGWMLRRRLTSEKGITVVDNLCARTHAWWVMVSVFAVAFLLGEYALIVLFAVVSFCALREFQLLALARRSDYKIISLMFFMLTAVQYWLIGMHWYLLFLIFIPIYSFLLLPALMAIRQDTENFLDRIAKIQWGIVFAIYCISYVPALLLLKVPGYAGQNALLVCYLLVVAQMSDILQFVFGMLFGKTRILPVVSPSKTAEGFLGGMIGATTIGAAMWWITPFTPLQSAGMALVIVVMGGLGGLSLSAVKRGLGTKQGFVIHDTKSLM